MHSVYSRAQPTGLTIYWFYTTEAFDLSLYSLLMKVKLLQSELSRDMCSLDFTSYQTKLTNIFYVHYFKKSYRWDITFLSNL